MADHKQPLELPARGTRGSRAPWGLVRYVRPLIKGQIARYRKDAGPEPPKMGPFPLVLLTTVGAKTGQERTQVLGGFNENGDVWLVIASKGGASTHPAWLINLAKNPDKVWLEVGNRKFHVRPTVLKGAELEAAYAKVVETAPRYGGYRTKTDREIPIVRLTPIS